MLFLYTSNQLEQLSGLLSSITSVPLDNVFTKETVVVQNAGMARWLSMQLADTTGISANIEYLFPAEFMWKILRIVSSDSDISKESQCTPDTLQYHLMEELSLNYNNYPELHHYIKNHKQDHIEEKSLTEDTLDEDAIWQLSVEMAQIFDQYLFFRSEWIEKWESTRGEGIAEKDWQARLWLRCVKDKKLIHWLALQKQFKESLSTIKKEDLPERVTFFSMPALSPGYLDLLGDLSKKVDIYLYMINPSKDIYWGDILSEKAQTKLSAEELQYAEVGNPLLASMGKQGRDFIQQLIELGECEHVSTLTNDFHNTSESRHHFSLLKYLQKDISTLSQPKEITTYNKAKDNSIQFNACHTIMREVEVLYDQILDALNTDTSLTPSDIVVMHPDIDVYTPYIETIFSNSHTRLPYSIADCNPLNALQLIEALLKILKLPDARFDVESVFEVLAYDDIRLKFNLDESQLEKCRKLARISNIRWGVSDKSRVKNRLPDTQEHTWKYALDSLLLGYALGEGSTDKQLFDINNPLPLFAYNEIEGSDSQILANLKYFTDIIFGLTAWADARLSIDLWLDKLKDLINLLFIESPDTSLILESLNNIKKTTELTNFTKGISFTIFNKIVKDNLSSISSTEKFLGHGITFCAMVPMRSIPFKLIALMGMNDGEFPRQNKHHSFDRLAEKPRHGDRSKRDEDRYLFLESILAAKSRLIISYIGQSVKDNTDLPPSILVNELLDTLEIYSQVPSEKWLTKHPLQAFSSRYFNRDSDLYSYAKEYTEINNLAQPPSQIFIDKSIAELKKPPEKISKHISLNDLIHFYQSPSRAFLKYHFGIQTFDEDVVLPIREPFDIEGFNNAEIRHLITTSIEKESQLISRAKGLLPYGEIGTGIYYREKRIIDEFEANLPVLSYQESQKFSLQLGEFTLYGEVDNLADTGRIIKALTQAYFPSFIDIWFNHLVLNIIKTSNLGNQSIFYSPEESFSLPSIENIDVAFEELKLLLDFYWQGLHFPLNFFPKSAKALYDKPSPNLKLAVNAWNGTNQRAGEKNKFENWLLHRTLQFDESHIPSDFLQISELIFGNIYSHYEALE